MKIANKKIAILGSEGFIGKNLVEYYTTNKLVKVGEQFTGNKEYFVYCYDKKIEDIITEKDGNIQIKHEHIKVPKIKEPEEEDWGTFSMEETIGTKFHCDLTKQSCAKDVLANYPDIIINAAASTSGANDIVNRPYIHVTDNAIMNVTMLQELFNWNIQFSPDGSGIASIAEGIRTPVKHYIFFSCTVMYPQDKDRPITEEDFTGSIANQYFGVGWTKVYIEKMMEFYSKILPNIKFTVIRHSNIYGSHDKFDLEKSHVFGATLNKVLTTPNGGEIEVWGDGSTVRDLLYVDDLIDFVNRVIEHQKSNFEIYNVGSGIPVSVSDLVQTVIDVSGKKLRIKYNKDKPSFKNGLWLDYSKAEKETGWKPQTDLRDGIEKTINWLHNRIVEV